MNRQGNMVLGGTLGMKVQRAAKAPLSWRIKNWLRWGYVKGWLAWYAIAPFARKFGIATMMGKLEARLLRKDGAVIDYGVVGRQLVTTAFVNFVVDQL